MCKYVYFCIVKLFQCAQCNVQLACDDVRISYFALIFISWQFWWSIIRKKLYEVALILSKCHFSDFFSKIEKSYSTLTTSHNSWKSVKLICYSHKSPYSVHSKDFSIHTGQEWDCYDNLVQWIRLIINNHFVYLPKLGIWTVFRHTQIVFLCEKLWK